MIEIDPNTEEGQKILHLLIAKACTVDLENNNIKVPHELVNTDGWRFSFSRPE